MNVTKTNLFIKDHTGKIRVWSIGVRDWTIEIEHGVLFGSMQEQTEEVPEGLAGRTREEQIMLRMASRIKKRQDIGYVNSIEKAKTMPKRNELGLYMPMLAKRYDQVKKPNLKHAFMQLKYNGLRCLIHNNGEQLIAYSRKGKILPGAKYILDEIEVPENETIDGELYCHGIPLQTINSWAKKLQPNSAKLQYVAYDMVLSESYDFRRMFIKELCENKQRIIIANTIGISDESQIAPAFIKAKEDGYEGLILRLDNCGYEDGLKRSNSLIKVKKINGFGYIDHEYKVIDVVPSKDNWGILVCDTPHGTFRVVAPGTLDKKAEILENKYDYIGGYVLVEFPEFTKDMLPSQPVAIEFVDPEDK